jgi:polyphosphate kinase
VRFCDIEDLDEGDQRHLQLIFEERVFPVLTPLAVDPAHPFPYISNLSMNLAVLVGEPGGDEPRFARVKVPPVLPRFLIMPDGERIVPLEQVIAANLDALPGARGARAPRVPGHRNADFEVEEEEADDLLAAIETELTRRRFGRVVRLEVTPDMSEEALDLLVRELNISTEDVLELPGPLDLSGLWALYGLDRPDLKQPTFTPTTQPLLAEAGTNDLDIFEAIDHADILVQHPYDSFTTSVQAFLEQAARDPDVLAIKWTLYRTTREKSPIVAALKEAAEEGKSVTAVIELKARFDETTNITLARELEKVGVQVVYGFLQLKTHAKLGLVVRREGGGVATYCHIGTGNYHPVTARVYTDLSFFTADPAIGRDVTRIFNFVTGYGKPNELEVIAASPGGIRERMMSHIRAEIEHAKAGRPAAIWAKMNALVDSGIITALYEASQAGVEIDLVVRSICCLRPGVPGLSDNIRVKSLVGRYLEHSRIYRFGSPERGLRLPDRLR